MIYMSLQLIHHFILSQQLKEEIIAGILSFKKIYLANYKLFIMSKALL